MIVDHLLLEIVPLFLVSRTFQLFLNHFGLHIEQGSVLNGEVLVLLHNLCQFLLEVFVDGIEVVELLEKDEVLLVFLLQLFPHFEDGLPHDLLFID